MKAQYIYMYIGFMCGFLKLCKVHVYYCRGDKNHVDELLNKETTEQYGLVNQRSVGACIACGPICGSQASPHSSHILRRSSQHSFHSILSSKWR